MRDSKKICDNTYLRRAPEGVIVVRLYNTDILSFFPDDRVKYDSGGWRTSTTKKRMNDYGPLGNVIHQRQFQWQVKTETKSRPFLKTGTKSVPFLDDLIAKRDGELWKIVL